MSFQAYNSAYTSATNKDIITWLGEFKYSRNGTCETCVLLVTYFKWNVQAFNNKTYKDIYIFESQINKQIFHLNYQAAFNSSIFIALL